MTFGFIRGLVDPQQNLVKNYDFTSPKLNWGTSSTTMTNWTGYPQSESCMRHCTTAVTWSPTYPNSIAGTSNTSPYLWSQHICTSNGQYVQTVVSGLEIGTTYRISFWAAGSTDGSYTGVGTLTVSMDGTAIYTTPSIPRQKAMKFYSTTWVATTTSVTLKLSGTIVSGGSLRLFMARVYMSPIDTVVSATS